MCILLNYSCKVYIHHYPTWNRFQSNIVNKPLAEKERFYRDKISQFVNEHIFQRNQSPPNGVEEDYVKNYVLCYIYLTYAILQLKDTAAEAHGDRHLINQKWLLSIFRSLNSFSKYSIKMFVSIAQMEALLTPRMSEESKWGLNNNSRLK